MSVLVTCSRCDSPMAGSMVSAAPVPVCQPCRRIRPESRTPLTPERLAERRERIARSQEIETRTCERHKCAAEFTVARSARRRFCSTACASAARKMDRSCTNCGVPMWRRSAPEPYCRECRAALAVRKCIAPGCDGKFRFRSQKPEQECCSRSCADLVRSLRAMGSTDFDPSALPELRRTKQLARSRARKLRRAQTWDGFTDAEIFARDGWRCQIPQCTYRIRVIRRDIAYPDPRSASVDHVIPLSEGGDDTSANKRASHLRCNLQRRNVGGNDQLALFGMPGEPRLIPGIAGLPMRRKPVTVKPPKPCCGQTGKHAADCEILLCNRESQAERRAWRTEHAPRALALRAQGKTWRQVAGELGLARASDAYILASEAGDAKAVGPDDRKASSAA